MNGFTLKANGRLAASGLNPVSGAYPIRRTLQCGRDGQIGSANRLSTPLCRRLFHLKCRIAENVKMTHSFEKMCEATTHHHKLVEARRSRWFCATKFFLRNTFQLVLRMIRRVRALVRRFQNKSDL